MINKFCDDVFFHLGTITYDIQTVHLKILDTQVCYPIMVLNWVIVGNDQIVFLVDFVKL